MYDRDVAPQDPQTRVRARLPYPRPSHAKLRERLNFAAAITNLLVEVGPPSSVDLERRYFPLRSDLPGWPGVVTFPSLPTSRKPLLLLRPAPAVPRDRTDAIPPALQLWHRRELSALPPGAHE